MECNMYIKILYGSSGYNKSFQNRNDGMTVMNTKANNVRHVLLYSSDVKRSNLKQFSASNCWKSTNFTKF